MSSVMEPATALFDRHAVSVALGGDRPFVLRGASSWLVESGQVDVFSVRVEDQRPVGYRSHVLRVDAGQAVFATPGEPAGRGLMAVGTVGTRVRQLTCEDWARHSADPEVLPALHALVESWVEALCSSLSHEAGPKRSRELEPGPEVDVGAKTSARPRKEVCWIGPVEGRAILLGRPGLELDGTGLTPLSPRVWIDAPQRSRLRVAPTREVGGPSELWAALARLHALVLNHSEDLAGEARAADVARTRRKEASQSARLQEACSVLVRTMEPRTTASAMRPDESEAAAEAALLLACRAVGEEAGIEIKAPPSQGVALKEPLAAILAASRVRSRRVALRDEWWRQDHGPLLGYVAEGLRPVALLPSGDGYLLREPSRGEERVVTAAEAAGLAPFAFTLHRPFGDGALSVKDLIRFGLQGCRGDALVVFAVGVGAALLGLIPPIATALLFDSVIPGARRGELLQLTVLLLVCVVASSLLSLTRGLALLRVEERMGAALQAAVWDRLLALPLSFFRPFSAGDLAVRAMAINAIRQLVSGTTVAAVMGGIFSLVNFGLMFYYSSEMAGWAALLIVVALVVTAAGALLQIRPQRALLDMQAKTSGLVLQLLSSVAKLKVAGAEVHAFALWADRFAQQRRLQFRIRTVGKWVTAFNAAFPTLASMVIFWVGLPRLSGPDPLPTGHFLAFLAAFAGCLSGLLGTLSAALGMLNVFPLFEQARPILETRPEVNVDKADPGPLSGDIEVQHAVFRYSKDGPVVLKDVSFRAAPGEFVALVGPSGSGKSTLLRLLLGFDALESGSIYYDGQELEGLDIQAVRRQAGVVLQSGRLTAGDIYSNIVASAQATLEDAWEAARMAGVADDIKAMPMGMHTVVSEGGGTLSGGQRQRVLIARAIVQRPRLLFFDEATSALDNATQAIVSASLERLRATRIVIAHRLSTIVNADRIYVLEQGRIVQSGTYSQLIAQEGTFADIARRQIH